MTTKENAGRSEGVIEGVDGIAENFSPMLTFIETSAIDAYRLAIFLHTSRSRGLS
jgi:hypothetical protein